MRQQQQAPLVGDRLDLLAPVGRSERHHAESQVAFGQAQFGQQRPAVAFQRAAAQRPAGLQLHGAPRCGLPDSLPVLWAVGDVLDAPTRARQQCVALPGGPSRGIGAWSQGCASQGVSPRSPLLPRKRAS